MSNIKGVTPLQYIITIIRKSKAAAAVTPDDHILLY